MHPGDLKTDQFSSYPPQARQLVVDNLALFRKLPEIMLSILLQEVIEYDWKFPAERKELEGQLSYLNALDAAALQSLVAGFAKLRLSSSLEKSDWVKSPREFVERLTADLWATHQMEAFRAVADHYQVSIGPSIPQEPPAMPRLGIAVVGQGVREYTDPLFQKLRPYGVYFKNVEPDGGINFLIDRLTKRALEHPAPYAHWYVEGGGAIEISTPTITTISYSALGYQRKALLGKMQTAINSSGGGPEALRTFLAQMRPQDLAGCGKSRICATG